MLQDCYDKCLTPVAIELPRFPGFSPAVQVGEVRSSCCNLPGSDAALNTANWVPLSTWVVQWT